MLQQTRIACENEHVTNLKDLRDCTNEQLKDLVASIRKRKEGTKLHPDPAKAARDRTKLLCLEVLLRSGMDCKTYSLLLLHCKAS